MADDTLSPTGTAPEESAGTSTGQSDAMADAIPDTVYNTTQKYQVNGVLFHDWNQFQYRVLTEKLTEAQRTSWTTTGRDKIERFYNVDFDTAGKPTQTPLDPDIITLLADWVCEEMTRQIPEHVGYAIAGEGSWSDRVFDREQYYTEEGKQEKQRMIASMKKAAKDAAKKEKKEEKEKEKEEKQDTKDNEEAEKKSTDKEEKVKKATEKAQKAQEKIQKKANKMLTDAINTATETAEQMMAKFDDEKEQESLDEFQTDMNQWVEDECKKIDDKLEKYVKELYNILVNAHEGRLFTLRALNKQLERMIKGIRKIVETSKEDAEAKTKELQDSVCKQYLQKQQQAAADAAKKTLKAAQDEANRLTKKAQTAADSAVQQLQGKIDALAGK